MARWFATLLIAATALLYTATAHGEAVLEREPSPFRQTVEALIAGWDHDQRQTYASTAYYDLIGYHRTVGMHVRNTYFRHGGIPIGSWLHDRGVRHVDMMSGYILEAAWLELNGCELNLDEPFGPDFDTRLKLAEASDEELPTPQLPHPTDICPDTALIGAPLGIEHPRLDMSEPEFLSGQDSGDSNGATP